MANNECYITARTKERDKKEKEDPEPEFQEHEVEAQSGDIRSGDDRRRQMRSGLREQKKQSGFLISTCLMKKER